MMAMGVLRLKSHSSRARNQFNRARHGPCASWAYSAPTPSSSSEYHPITNSGSAKPISPLVSEVTAMIGHSHITHQRLRCSRLHTNSVKAASTPVVVSISADAWRAKKT